MSAAQTGIPKPKLKGRKRPEHSAKMKALWDDEARREDARERGNKMAADPEWRLRIAESLSGDKNPRWLGGISKQEYAPGFSRTLKRQIRERDGHRCQLCGATEDELGYTFSIHHSDYDKTNHDPANLFSTCKPCNSRVNTNRELWLTYFLAVRSQLGQDVGNFRGRQVITQRKDFVHVGITYPDDPIDIPTVADHLAFARLIHSRAAGIT